MSSKKTGKQIRDEEDYGAVLASTPYFFVYGTLQTDYHNNALFGTSSRFVRTDKTEMEFFLIDVGFPYAIPSWVVPKKHSELLRPVWGEVWEVTNKKVARSLDTLEGYPSHYNRTLVQTSKGHWCWMYYLDEMDPVYYAKPCSYLEGAWKW